ncbi:MAG: pyridoxamine 5'-phosphate oxidase family protein [Henriciella sp.]
MTSKHFHRGELELQDRVGMREKIEVMSQHMMRDFMPDQHREFFESLEYAFIGSVDQSGRPHASILTGPVGFIRSPDAHTLVINTGVREDRTAFDALAIGNRVGFLGLELSNRRRNRMHGFISAMDATSITISVVQSYGNCPKYISLRDIVERDQPVSADTAVRQATLAPADIDLVKSADTFFISSYVRDQSGAAYEGADISHRGGAPGFVSVEAPNQITIPDYTGNNMFNTLGNLLINPKAGLLFLDFESGDQLHLHGHATIIDDGNDVDQFPGAKRLLRITVEGVERAKSSFPLRWRFVESSPFNP